MAFMAETTPSLGSRRQATLGLLKGLTPQWLDLRQRYDRSEHFDAGLKAEYKDINGHMNRLLEDYFTLTAGVELPEVEIYGVD